MNVDSRESDESINVGWKVENIVWRTNGLWTSTTVEELFFSPFVRLLFIHSLSLYPYSFLLFLSSSFLYFRTQRTKQLSRVDNRQCNGIKFKLEHIVSMLILYASHRANCRSCFFFSVPRAFQLTAFLLPNEISQIEKIEKMRLFRNTTHLQSDTRNVSYQCKQWMVFAWKYFVVNQEANSPRKTQIENESKNTFSCSINKHENAIESNNERSCRKHLANFHFFTWTQSTFFVCSLCSLCYAKCVPNGIQCNGYENWLVRYCVTRLYSGIFIVIGWWPKSQQMYEKWNFFFGNGIENSLIVVGIRIR